MDKLVNKLRLMRDRAGMSLEDAAEALDISHTTLSRWERGDLPLTIANIKRCAALYGCREIDLVVDVGVIAENERERAILSLVRSIPEESAKQVVNLLDSLARRNA